MANHQKGEFEIKTSEKIYKFKLDYNALCEVEQKTGKPITDLLDDMGLSEIRTIMWAGLYNCDESITEQEAGRIIGEIGVNAVSTFITDAVQYIFPSQDKGNSTTKPKTGNKRGKGKSPGARVTSLNS